MTTLAKRLKRTQKKPFFIPFMRDYVVYIGRRDVNSALQTVCAPRLPRQLNLPDPLPASRAIQLLTLSVALEHHLALVLITPTGPHQRGTSNVRAHPQRSLWHYSTVSIYRVPLTSTAAYPPSASFPHISLFTVVAMRTN